MLLFWKQDVNMQFRQPLNLQPSCLSFPSGQVCSLDHYVWYTDWEGFCSLGEKKSCCFNICSAFPGTQPNLH